MVPEPYGELSLITIREVMLTIPGEHFAKRLNIYEAIQAMQTGNSYCSFPQRLSLLALSKESSGPC